ncbi:MAG: DUF1552 domain-containing protein [Natronospirillum sp.]
MKTTLHNRSRRRFLTGLAQTGLLLPFAGQLIAQKAFASSAPVQRVLFMYFPNGVVPDTWRPASSGPISTNDELSFGLGPLRDWHNQIIVLRNMFLDIGGNGGAHYEPIRGIMTGNHQIGAGGASIDHLLAEQLGCEAYTLGVRTGSDAGAMISKPRNFSTTQRPIPNNDPADAAQKLMFQINPSGGEVSDLKRRMYEAILQDFDSLANASLEATRRNKVDMHESALLRLRDQTAVQVGDCSFAPTQVSDPYLGGGGDVQERNNLIPAIARAQINNALGALSCGLTRVATLQLFKGDENTGLANYSFDECWDMVQLASARGINGGHVTQRWWNEHASHTASHNELGSHSAQVRWYHSLLAYTLEQLQTKGILDDTLVVLFSEVGDGAQHGQAAGAVTLAGGASGAVQMGRVIHCGNGQNQNNHRIHGTRGLFGDIAQLMGVHNLASEGWSEGGVIL